MTVHSPHDLIDFQSFRQSKRQDTFYSTSSARRLSPALHRTFNQSVRHNEAGSGKDFDKRLQIFENYSRHQYTRVFKALALGKLPDCLQGMLDQDILPTLRRIGFESAISNTLFEIAQSAWNPIISDNKKLVPFQPMIDHEVQEVLHGIKLENDSRRGVFPGLALEPQVRVFGSIKESMSPEHLFKMFDKIVTPWIILPRAFRFLEVNQSHYLPQYVKTLKVETREICLKLLSRITVEFIGNFAFKFADRHYPRRRLSKLLFYGYSVLFWKTLRCPPRNMENSLAFDNYLNWLKRFSEQIGLLGEKENAFLNQMVAMRNRAFPALHSMRPHSDSRPNSSRFIVTLRHGRVGLATVLKYIGIDQFLNTRQTANRFACATFQHELNCLLSKIRTQYLSESKPTRKNIEKFIGWIRVAYDILQPSLHQTQRQFIDRILTNIKKSVIT